MLHCFAALNSAARKAPPRVRQRRSYDPNASAVFAHGGGQIGYLSREDAVEYKAVSAALISQNAVGLCRARLIGGTDGKPSIGVMLDLAEPQTLLQSLAPSDAPF